MTKDSSIPTRSTLDPRFAELGFLERTLVEQDLRLREEQAKARALVKENKNLRKKLDAHLAASKSKLASLATESGKHIDSLKKSLGAKEKERFEIEQRLLVSTAKGGFSLHPDAKSDGDFLNFESKAVEAQQRRFLTSQLLRSGEQPEPINKGWLEEFPNLRSTKGFLFVITYPYSGASETITAINELDNIHILGNIGQPLIALARAHRASRYQVSSEASGKLLGHEVLGWHLADCFVRNMIAPTSSAPISGATLSYSGHDKNELLDTLLFIYSYFPNARFIFVSGSPGDISKKHTPPSMTPEKMNRRIQHLNRCLTQFNRAFPEVCLIQSPKSSASSGKVSALEAFLERFLSEVGVIPDLTTSVEGVKE